MPSCHYIPRSHGGLGIEQNIVTACIECHHMMDNSTARRGYLERAKWYLEELYPGFTDKERIFNKWDGLPEM